MRVTDEASAASTTLETHENPAGCADLRWHASCSERPRGLGFVNVPPRLRMRAFLLALLGLNAGCLFVDPILPAEEENTPPSFSVRQPSGSEKTMPYNTQNTSFIARATDRETPRELLQYVWLLNGEVKREGEGEDTYTSNGVEIGAGGPHELRVIVTDDGTPELSITTAWTINVQ